MSEYKHGAYGALGETVATAVAPSETVPVYAGTAPANLVTGAAVGSPVKIASAADARAKIGYSDDWGSFTLCEAVAAHFAAGEEGVGPIYVINALDPEACAEESDRTALLTFAAGRAHIQGDTIILSTLKLETSGGDALEEGDDYTVSYDFAAGRAVIESADAASPITGEVTATWRAVDPAEVSADDVAAAVGAAELVYQEFFAVPNLLAAPGWSDEPAVYRAMVEAATKMNGHWDAFVLADLPLGSGNTVIDDVEDAIEWKEAHGYSSERSAVFWPMAADAEGRAFHLSTLACAEALRADAANDGVPFESWSNRAVPVSRQLFATGRRGFDQRVGNALNEAGVTTAVGWGGEWVLWGPHTAAFRHGAPHDPRSTFATTMRMLFHLSNGFQQRWSGEIDKPMTPALRDRILNGEQAHLDALVAMGALVGSPRISFEAAENPASSLMEGDFLWDVAVTAAVPMKSATVRVAYTDEGLSAYTEGDE